LILTITMNPALDKVYAVDDYAVGGVFRPRAMTATAGGKGLNVARVARLLGEPVMATGVCGGRVGRFIVEQIGAAGIESRFIPIGQESRTCVAIVDQRNNTSTEVLEYGPAVSSGEYDLFLENYEGLLDECSVAVASGSLPGGIPLEFYRTLGESAGRKGRKFILDASGEPFRLGLEGHPYMVKPNQDELAALLGMGLDLPQQAGALWRLKEAGIQMPCLTLGGRGCLAALADGVYHYQPPLVTVASTVGSGDSFVAGCATGLSRGLEAKEAVRLGMACAIANTQFFATGMISAELVDKFLPEVVCEKLRF